MKRITYTLVLLILTVYSYAQTGTIGDPFTSLKQGAAVTIAGVYYFNIGGNVFDTYVDANGYVQVAIDFGNGSGNLPQGSSLTTAARGILNATILGALTEIQIVRISSSTANFDVTTTDATIIGRIQSNTTLHQGTADNSINDNWTGTNAAYITANASCITVDGTSLHENIVHACGNTAGYHWIPSSGTQREQFASGEIANSAFFQLWVKGDITLPIELLNFDATIANNEWVELNWQTSSEINNDYFTIERSMDGINWEIVKNIDGSGNSSTLLNYSGIDSNPYSGISYYRLKQTDFDGQFSYSQIRSINLQRPGNPEILIYPNPVNDKLTIKTRKSGLGDVHIYNVLGKNVNELTRQIITHENTIVIDFSQLNSGTYYIKSKNAANRVHKQ